MIRTTRGLAALAAAGLAVPLWVVPAHAETGNEAATSGAYFNSTGIAKPDELAFQPPNVTSDHADGVDRGKLGVAARNGEVDKVSFLFFSLSAVPVGSTITKAVMTVPLAPTNDGKNINIAAAPAKVRACKNGPEGFGGEDGTALRDAPKRLCDEFSAPATASDDGKAYVFDISGLASLWAEINDGVALAPAVGADSTNFQVVFESMDKATLSYEYTPPPVEDFSAFDSTTGTDLSGTGTTTDLGSFDSGTGSADLGFGSTEAPFVGGELPAGPVPETATEEPTVAAEQQSGGGPIEILTPTAGFWLSALALGGALVLLSLIMGDPRASAAAAATRPSRLSMALSSRHGGRLSSLAASRPV